MNGNDEKNIQKLTWNLHSLRSLQMNSGAESGKVIPTSSKQQPGNVSHILRQCRKIA